MEVWRSSGDGEAAAAAVSLPVQFVYEPYLSAMPYVDAAPMLLYVSGYLA